MRVLSVVPVCVLCVLWLVPLVCGVITIGTPSFYDPPTNNFVFSPSPWPTTNTQPSGYGVNGLCNKFIISQHSDCCIDTDSNGVPISYTSGPGGDYGYGDCASSGEEHCPGGVLAGCTSGQNGANNGNSCPTTVSSTDFGTLTIECRLASEYCRLHDNHCWGTLQCYDSQNVIRPCPPIVAQGTQGNTYVYGTGSFCFEAGGSDNVKWCGCPSGSAVTPNGQCCPEGQVVTEDGQCSGCPAGEVLIGVICCPEDQVVDGHCVFNPPLHGDPQIGGFQGQSYQFHGLPDEVFNLISTPTLQLNSHFVYLSSGKCDYNDTECWSHPGTYIDQLGFSFGSHKLKIVAGTHTVGLRLNIDGEPVSYGNYKLYANGSDVHIKYHQHGKVHIKTHEFAFTIFNSDMFFNMETALLDHHLLRVGAPKHTITDSTLCKKEDSIDHSAFQASQVKHEHNHGAVEAAIQKKYGGVQVPLHGLIGQTWRNVLVCNKHWVGSVTDYVCSDLFASDYFFNFYHPE